MPVLDLLDAIELLDVAPATLDDDALVGASGSLGELRRRVDAASAAVAAEMKHRSRPELGFQGLAQRTGAGTTENLIQQVAGTSKREASALVRVGELLTVDADPWLTQVGSGVAAGRVSIEKADVIRAGLGSPTADVAADDLADAAAQLVALAPTLTVDRLAARARELRDDLDISGVRDREQLLHDKRYLNFIERSDGMLAVNGLLDPEGGAFVRAAYDAATSPRRGGPRFVDEEDRAAADAIVNDERTLGQIAADTFVDLIRVATLANPDKLLGARRHSVRVLVTAHDLAIRTGAAFFAGQTDAVSIETAERHICDVGILPIQFDDDGEPLRRGRTQRLYTSAQRDVIEARDGGCRFPKCDRPASWSETHHVEYWSRGGATDTSVGVLLCRHHHMLIHHNGWGIERDPDHGFVTIPPRTRDPQQRPIPMPPRSRAAARLRT